MKSKERMTGAALAASVFLALIFGMLLYRSMGFIYAIADDIIMRDIASGAFTGTPDGHLIFVQYALGFLLSRMYLWLPSVDWYGFFMTGVIFLGLAAVLYRGLSADKTPGWKAVYTGLSLGIFGCAMIFHAAQFEWTVSAAAAGASGLYLYITMREDVGRVQRILDSVLVWLLLILTYGIRDDVFLMVLPGLGISFLWKIFRKGEGRIRVVWREIILPAAVFLTLGLMILVERQAYDTEEWDRFGTFQSARSDIYDYYGVPAYEKNPSFFEEEGIDEAELRNLRHYALYLVDGMDAELMSRLGEEAERQSGQTQGLKSRLWNGVKLAAEQAAAQGYYTASIPFLLFLAGALLLACRYCRKAFLPLLLFLGAEGTLWLYLGFMGRLPERVAFSMHLTGLAGMAGLFLLLWEKRKKQIRGGNAVMLALLVCSLAAAAFQWKASAEANEEKLAMDDSYQQFKQSCREHPENLYFIETFMAEPVGGARVTTEYSPQLNNCLTLGDWYSTSPLDAERMEELGIQNVEETILQDPNAYLVVRDVEDPGFLGDYFQEKYPGYTLVCRRTEVVGGRNYYLYQVSAG